MTALSLVHALRPPAPGANAEGERPPGIGPDALGWFHVPFTP